MCVLVGVCVGVRIGVSETMIKIASRHIFHLSHPDGAYEVGAETDFLVETDHGWRHLWGGNCGRLLCA